MSSQIPKLSQELISRYLNGTCSPEEVRMVEQWYDAIEISKEYDWNKKDEQKRADFISKLTAPSKRNKVMRFTAAFRTGAAAAVLFLIGLTFYWVSMQGTSTSVAGKVQRYAVACGPGAVKKIVLPDSSVVWLNANSSLSWDANYGAGLREVSLSGEGSFDVTKNKIHPFVVHARNINVRVLGTFFNVQSNNSTREVKVALLRGKVAVSSTLDKHKNATLTPGMTAYCSADNITTHFEDVEPYVSWMQGGFYVKDLPLKQAIGNLADKYGYTVQWNTSMGLSKHISIAFQYQKFDDMLASLCYMNHLRYKISGNQIIMQ